MTHKRLIEIIETNPDYQNALDELVHDTANQIARHVNNQGVSHRLSYLLAHGWSITEIRLHLEGPPE